MTEESQTSSGAYLIGVCSGEDNFQEKEKLLDELENLTASIGFPSVGRQVVRVSRFRPAYLIGTGKTEEIIREAVENNAAMIVFNEDLSPSQQRNWEKRSSLCVIDRHEVILDIFAARASTKEAVLQVELARLEYSLPRLTRAWTHLSRQRGGARGTRGEGESQLEIDRRYVLSRIAKIKNELTKVRRYRATQRKKRESIPLPSASIVGYTNAGKSTLLNVLTGSHVLEKDNLFATLDPTTRRFRLPCGRELLITDTVGFIRDLPHDLVDAFRSTLEETLLSDFLIHVIDASDPDFKAHITSTFQVLKELGAEEKPQIMVFNKIDRIPDDDYLGELKVLYPEGFFISVKTGAGTDAFVHKLDSLVRLRYSPVFFAIPLSRQDMLSLVHRSGVVLEESYVDSRIEVKAEVPEKTKNILAEFIIKHDDCLLNT